MKHVIKRLIGLSCIILGLLFVTNFAVAQEKDKVQEPPKEDPIDPEKVAEALQMKQVEAILNFHYETEGKDGSSTEKDDTKGTPIESANSDTKGWGSLPLRDVQNIMKVRALEEVLSGIARSERGGPMGFAGDEKGAADAIDKEETADDETKKASTYGKEATEKAVETKDDVKAETYGFADDKDKPKTEAIEKKYVEDPAAQAETIDKEGNGKVEETKEDVKAETHGWAASSDEDKKAKALEQEAAEKKEAEMRAEALEQEAKEAAEKLKQIAEALSTDQDVSGYAQPRRCNCTTMSCLISCIKKIIKVEPKKKIKKIRVKKMP